MNWRENETLDDAAARLLAGWYEREKRKASGRLQAPEQIADANGNEEGHAAFLRISGAVYAIRACARQ